MRTAVILRWCVIYSASFIALTYFIIKETDSEDQLHIHTHRERDCVCVCVHILYYNTVFTSLQFLHIFSSGVSFAFICTTIQPRPYTLAYLITLTIMHTNGTPS